ncbi:FmdB family zinc ribbon protein [Pseudonocardia acidicola]|uniref:Zinc ribbon domain-containing protein n=1 Tax=Pseudonocardia acidicola TaxID=2724939 RepID=A0ABX1SB64_9PSEU|nr:FmdB family zinc ribbon protein [Pseudonocardia acidicola]NMH98795.1 zinc ribbon domain-containing protein [Pseudonocardia acidicola]
MAGYQYRCPDCGVWDVALAMGTAEATRDCPDCGRTSARRYTAPSLNRMPAPQARARLREEASRDVPEVVTAVPPKARRPVVADPRTAALPRP